MADGLKGLGLAAFRKCSDVADPLIVFTASGPGPWLLARLGGPCCVGYIGFLIPVVSSLIPGMGEALVRLA